MDNLYIADVLNVTAESNKLMISLAYEEGYTIKDGVINGTKKTISSLTSGDLMDNLYIADVLNVTAESSKLMISLAYEEGYTIKDGVINGTKKKVSSLTSGNLVDDLYLADVLNLDGTSSKLMLSLAYEEGYTINPDNSIMGTKKKISSLTSGDITEDLYLADVMNIDGTSSKLMLSLAYEEGYTINPDNSITGTKKKISTLTNSDLIDSLYVADVLNVTASSSRLMISLAYQPNYEIKDGKIIGTKKTISSLTSGDITESLYVADVLNVTATSSKLMLALAYEEGYRIVDGEIIGTKKTIKSLTEGNITDNLYIADVLNVNATSSKLMLALAYEDGYRIVDGEIIGTKKKISALTEGNITDNLYVADVLNVTATSSALMLSLAYEDGYTIHNNNTPDDKSDDYVVGTKKKVSSLTNGDLMNELYVADVLNITASSNAFMISVAYEKGYTIENGVINGTKKKLSDISDGTFIDNMEIYLAIGLDMNNANSISAIMRSLAFGKEYKGQGNKSDFDYEIIDNAIVMIAGKSPKTLSSMKSGDFTNDLTLGEIITISESSPAILRALEDVSLSNLNSTVNTLTLKNVLGEEQCNNNKLLSSMAEWKISEFGANVNNLKLGDVVSTEGAPKLLLALSDTKISELGSAINELTLGDMMDNVGDNFILKHLQNSTLTTLSTDISNLTIEEVFATDVYKMNGDKTKFLDENGNEIDETVAGWEEKRVLVGTWTFLLDEDIHTSGPLKTHKLTEMNTLITNMTNNIKRATLFDLNEAGILTLNNLDKTIVGTDIKLGDLTIEGLIGKIPTVG